MYHKILIPLDGSALAEKALDTAAGLARLTGAELVLFRALVLPSYHFAMPGAFPVHMSELLDGEREAAVAYLDGVRAGLTGVQVTARISEGKAAHAILAMADEENADLIVLASHGQGGLERWVYGSVAERVLRKSRKNLLLVRVFEEQAA